MDIGEIAQQVHHAARIARLNRCRIQYGDIAAGLLVGKAGGGDNDIFGLCLGDTRQTQAN